MDVFLLRVINYFSYRLQGVVQFKHVIEQVEISYRKYEHPYRQDLYYLINFKVSFQKGYKKQVTQKELTEIERLLRMSDKMSEVEYTSIERNLNTTGGDFISNKPDGENIGFLIRARDPDKGPYAREQYFKRLKEFVDLYNTLGLFITHFLTQFAPEIKLYAHNLDEHPEFNCFKKFWNDIIMPKGLYTAVCFSSFDNDVNQYFFLQRQQLESGSLKDDFLITDFEILQAVKLPINEIREFVIRYNVPYMLEGGKMIDKVVIDVYALRIALQHIPAESRSSFQKKLLSFIESKINTREAALLQQEQELEKFHLKKNDIVYLKGKIIAKVIDVKSVNGQFNCTYRLINKDLQVGQREAHCNPVEEVERILQADLFESLKIKYNWKYYRQLEGHIENKVKPVNWNRIKL